MTGLSECCLRGFEWEGTPTGKESEVAGIKTYVTGSSSSKALLYIHDALGWTFTNARLLADHYAREAGVTVYVADFFGGEVLPIDLLLQGQLDKVDIPSFLARNSREKREPEVVRFAQALREKYSFLGAIGFCYGGWAVFRLASGETAAAGGKPLIDCGIVGHPSLVEKPDVDGIRVPMQVLSPELDDLFNEELKLYTWRKLQENKVVFDWQFFPGMIHGALTRGDERVEGEREAMVRGKNAAVWWLKLHTTAKDA